MTYLLDRRAVLAAGTALAAGASARPTPDDDWARARAIATRVRVPRFARRLFDIRAYGATRGGAVSCTQAFADAIAACAAAGGGRVLVPAGRWLTGAIRLLSRVELHLEADATILFSTDPAHYPIVATRFEGVELMNYAPLIHASDAQDFAVKT